jgi:predicted RNA binding protein YcfA (HicA-like mRNA interferase family)
VVAALRKAGFAVSRIKGSHHFLRHDCEIERDDFVASL